MVDKEGKSSDKPRRRRGRQTEVVSMKPKSKTSTREGTVPDEDAFKFRPHKSPLIQLTEETPTWHECGRHTPGRDDTIFSDPPSSLNQQSSQLVTKYRALADSIYKVEVQVFASSRGGQGSSSDERWVESTMKRGTLKDRIAAMSVVVSTDPVHKLYALDGLLQLAGCSETNPGQANSRVAQMAAEALADLFLNTLLPTHRKLVMLDQRPLFRYSSDGNKSSKKTLSPRILLLWRYEEMIKAKYQLFVRHYLTHTLREGMDISKVFALRTSGALLRSIPECEAQLLSIMVNKLGDPAKKIAAAAGHELRRVLDQHSNMQLVVAREVQQLSHRPHLSPRALYNCIIFLNQLKLVREEEPDKSAKKGRGSRHDESDDEDEQPKKASREPSSNLPASLINTYFRLFEVAVNKTKAKEPNQSPSGMKSRLLSALLTGVNRAHPYLPTKDKHMEEHIDSLYRIVHTAPPSACTQALMLLFHLAVGSQYEEGLVVADERKATKAELARQDRFYRALYATLSQPSLVSSGKHLTMFFNLLYKAMKYDADSVRVVAMAKRLLCTSLNCNAPVLAASLFLLNEVMKYHPALKSGLEDIFEGHEAMAILDPTKREPRGALVCFQDSDESSTVGELAKRAPMWEAALISHHYHPSVSKFATTLGDISYSGDPLRDFSLAPFLDKFAYRNPKSAKSIAQHWKRGESIAERRSGTEGEIEALMSLPVNDPAFMEKQTFNEQEEFFRKFFVERNRRDEIKGVVRGKGVAAESYEEENEEKRAFDEAEAMEVDNDYNADYDTDSEEEAFVNSLAEKLIESSENGKVNYDDEDPDMEGWSDIDSANDGGLHNSEEAAFMNSSGDESGIESSEGNSDSDADGIADLALVTGSESEEEEDNNEKSPEKKHVPSDAFVDASEYEAIIEKSWKERKRPLELDADAGDEAKPKAEATIKAASSSKQRKRPKKKRKA